MNTVLKLFVISVLTANLSGCGGDVHDRLFHGGRDAHTDAPAEAQPISDLVPNPAGVCAGSADCVNLGAAGNFVILAKSGISTVPNSVITGNMGVSPIDQTAITGFSLVADATNTFATATQVTGKIYAADFAPPTPSELTTAVSNMETAYTDAAGRAAGVTELGAGNISGLTLAPGVYKWGTGVSINTDVTLSGDGVYIFQVAQDVTLAAATRVLLINGAQAKNVFWQIFGILNIGTTAHFEGVALVQTAISVGTLATVNGRLLAQTAVSLDQNTVK